MMMFHFLFINFIFHNWNLLFIIVLEFLFCSLIIDTIDFNYTIRLLHTYFNIMHLAKLALPATAACNAAQCISPALQTASGSVAARPRQKWCI